LYSDKLRFTTQKQVLDLQKKCGKLHDKDVLAANNIKDFAFHKQNLIQYKAELTRINTQGDDKITEQKCSVVV
jgi:hypothetical protein